MALARDEQDQTDDVWSTWLFNRDGGDAEYGKKLMQYLHRMRDCVLDSAELKTNMTLLDIGSGDGLIALGALERMGKSLRVIVTDISRPMLRYIERIASDKGWSEQCTFHTCSAEQLDDLWDNSVDVITTRASLAFVEKKPLAFAEFFRVLKPGGRISFCEPILQDKALETMALDRMIAADPHHPRIEQLKLVQRFATMQFPGDIDSIAKNPLTNFCERDLVSMAYDAGFRDIHLRLHLDIEPGLITSWNVFLNTSPHPWLPKSGEILKKIFSESEQKQFEHDSRASMEANQSITKDTFAYLTAIKPQK